MRVGDAVLPPGRRIYAVGDIHGRYDCLLAMLDLIEADNSRQRPASRAIIFIGDYIDRGPDSRKVIELLCELSQQDGFICLKGNHEAGLRRFFREPESFAANYLHRGWGGVETLASYGISIAGPLDSPSLAAEFAKALPPHHHAFLSALQLSHCEGDYFFCHAGIRPGIPLAEQDAYDLVWIRDEFLSYGGAFDKVVVHGHTPVPGVDIREHRINIDTAAYETGVLSCVVLEGKQLRILQTTQ